MDGGVGAGVFGVHIQSGFLGGEEAGSQQDEEWETHEGNLGESDFPGTHSTRRMNCYPEPVMQMALLCTQCL